MDTFNQIASIVNKTRNAWLMLAGRYPDNMCEAFMHDEFGIMNIYLSAINVCFSEDTIKITELSGQEWNDHIEGHKLTCGARDFDGTIIGCGRKCHVKYDARDIPTASQLQNIAMLKDKMLIRDFNPDATNRKLAVETPFSVESVIDLWFWLPTPVAPLAQVQCICT